MVLNERLLEVMGDDVTQEQDPARDNGVRNKAVGGSSGVIDIAGLVNVDCEDGSDGPRARRSALRARTHRRDCRSALQTGRHPDGCDALVPQGPRHESVPHHL